MSLLNNPDFRVGSDKLIAARADRIAKEKQREMELPLIRTEGEAALRRLLPIAQSDTGQSSIVARFLLNLYNGQRFPFDLRYLRGLDYEPFDDCIAVLKMDSQPLNEIHEYFTNGATIFEEMARAWDFSDHAELNCR